MKEKILDYLRQHGDATITDLKRHLGEASEGDLAWEMSAPSNVFAGVGLSEQFAKALSELKRSKQIDLSPCSALLYWIGGQVPNLPVMTRVQEYKTEHWVPVLLVLYDSPAGKRSRAKSDAYMRRHPAEAVTQ